MRADERRILHGGPEYIGVVPELDVIADPGARPDETPFPKGASRPDLGAVHDLRGVPHVSSLAEDCIGTHIGGRMDGHDGNTSDAT